MVKEWAVKKSLETLNLNPQEWGCLVVVLLLHVVLALGVELSPDEAHYALYGLHLDWSYYDHPPLVGWVQWLPAHWPQVDWSLRIVPMVCWALSALLLVKLNQVFQVHLQSTQNTFINAVSKAPAREAGLESISSPLLLISLSPLLHLLGIALVPDALLMPLMCAIMLTTWKIVCADSNGNTQHEVNLRTWCVLGFLLGLAGLSKYTAVVMAVSVACVLLRGLGFSVFKRKELWLCALIALLMIGPVLYWNWLHQWISID
jgi:hypothetical protein